MDHLWWIAASVAAMGLIGGLVVWWQARARLVQIQRQLAWSEASRFALELHAEKVDARLDAMSKTLSAQQHALDLASREARRRAIAAAVATQAAAGGPPEWADTQPFAASADGYGRTRPAGLSR